MIMVTVFVLTVRPYLPVRAQQSRLPLRAVWLLGGR